MLVRFKYYHAWIFADAICNNSGLGFSGYDDNGEPKWDLASNVDVYGFEVNYFVEIDYESNLSKISTEFDLFASQFLRIKEKREKKNRVGKMMSDNVDRIFNALHCNRHHLKIHRAHHSHQVMT